jgi:molybdopterin synthase sulfur carrier subunit
MPSIVDKTVTRLLYFAWVREKVGRADEVVTLPASVVTVSDLMAWLKTRGPEYAAAFERSEVIRAAIDQKHVKPTADIREAREIAFFPPVTGG